MANNVKGWIQASNAISQRIEKNNVGQVIVIEKIDGAQGISLNPKTGAFTVENDSDYLVVAAPQVKNLLY